VVPRDVLEGKGKLGVSDRKRGGKPDGAVLAI